MPRSRASSNRPANDFPSTGVPCVSALARSCPRRATQKRFDSAIFGKGACEMAHALKFHTVVSGKTLRLPDLGAFEGKRVEVIVVEDEEQPSPTPPERRKLGILRGQLRIADDFDAPLPADMQASFDGDDAG
jgi:hypothetical protein